MTISIALALIAIGLLVGIISNIFGLGGGVVITPLLPLVIQISQHDLVATSLCCIVSVVILNVLAFARAKAIDWSVARRYGVLAAIGAFGASAVAGYLSEHILRALTLFMMLLLAVTLVRKPKAAVQAKQESSRYLPFSFLAGVATGLTGIGTGVILSPLFLAKKVVSHEKVSPTVNAILIFATLTAILTYAMTAIHQGRSVFDAIQVQYAFFIIIGAIAISRLARKWQRSMLEVNRRRWMVLVLSVLSVIALRAFIKGFAS